MLIGAILWRPLQLCNRWALRMLRYWVEGRREVSVRHVLGVAPNESADRRDTWCISASLPLTPPSPIKVCHKEYLGHPLHRRLRRLPGAVRPLRATAPRHHLLLSHFPFLRISTAALAAMQGPIPAGRTAIGLVQPGCISSSVVVGHSASCSCTSAPPVTPSTRLLTALRAPLDAGSAR